MSLPVALCSRIMHFPPLQLLRTALTCSPRARLAVMHTVGAAAPASREAAGGSGTCGTSHCGEAYPAQHLSSWIVWGTFAHFMHENGWSVASACISQASCKVQRHET